MKRVILFLNGSIVDGKVCMVTHSLEELLLTASGKFGTQAKRLFTAQGGEIDDVKLVRDDDILYVSTGEPFIALEQGAGSRTGAAALPPPVVSTLDWITLNVGGKYFTSSRCTFAAEPQCLLSRMFSDESAQRIWPSCIDKNGAYLIDRSPEYFEPLLNYLRHRQLILNKNVNPRGVLEEAKFYGVESAIPLLEQMIENEKKDTDNVPLTRRDVINALISSPLVYDLRFQGVNLAGADLSRLDLRNINFKYCNLTGCKLAFSNLSGCCLERADMSCSDLEGANLQNVKMLCANLDGANLKSCNFEDPAGSRANMEGVSLKCANLEGSMMAGVNLRVATLKHANLQNCDLRGAVLAGADLENCDLSGSDLHEANLRGANLKNAAFELMLTPLHMSQTIR